MDFEIAIKDLVSRLENFKNLLGYNMSVTIFFIFAYRSNTKQRVKRQFTIKHRKMVVIAIAPEI